MPTMRAGLSAREGWIVKARAVEDRLMRNTWQEEGYELLPKLRGPEHSDPGVVGLEYDTVRD